MGERYVLGLDIGIASVGWAVVGEDSHNIIEAGVRLFSSAEASQNQDRRSFRGIRRNKRRQQNRLKAIESFLEDNGFQRPMDMPIYPVEIRLKALDGKVEEGELFAALYNIGKHRGVSYLEDLEEAKDNDRVLANIKASGLELPCQIQYDRYQKYGLYRGTNVIDGETFINTFTIGMYEEEARRILNEQSKYHSQISEDFIEKNIQLLKSKREYYIGPGNEKSRTNYGVFKTSGETKDNLFDELRGKCSVYSGKHGMDEELRASGASISVQRYNVLNDLCNIKVDGEKLSKEQKKEVMKLLQSNKTALTITKALKKLYKIEPDCVTGFRIDKKGKEENHNFEPYRIMRKEMEVLGINIGKFPMELLDAMADIMTLNTETQGILDYMHNPERPEFELVQELSPEEIDAFIQIRRKKGSLFSKWSSFSYRLIKQIVPEMLESGDEQHTCITRMGIVKYEYQSKNKLDYKDIVDEIYNPVASRSIVQTCKIINALMKKYSFSNIVVEMPRDRNSDEEKQNIKKMQKNNEEMKKKALQFAGISEADIDYRKDKKILQKLKLYYKQKGRCLYSGRPIDIDKLINGSYEYEIDHIIPISISFDDSQANKVLVESDQNRKKSNMTPFRYLSSASGVWSYNEYKAYVLILRKEGIINEKHKNNLLMEEDITKQEVVQGFINRNINDTRYASKVVLNELDRFFKDKDTKVKVINGSMTSQLRKKTLEYNKDRELDYRHHAQDAMICCYTVLSLNRYNEKFLNVETGEIINRDELYALDKEDKEVYLSYSGWDVKNKILEFNDKIKFSHKVDTKVNRPLSDQTIYGTRKVDGEHHVVNKIKDIYDDKEYEKFKEKMDKDPSIFLMYKYDPQTWEKLIKVINMYPDVKGSPFKKYREEFGSFTKYAKKDNGPVIKELKYLDHKVGKGIDISHKYEGARNRVLLERLKPFRADIFYNKEKDNFDMVPIRISDFKFAQGKYILPENVYADLLRSEGVLKEGQSLCDLESNGYEFRISTYRNNIIEFGSEELQKYRFMAKNHNAKNKFEVKDVDKVTNKRTFKGLTQKLNHCVKYNVDILGNEHKIVKEPLKLEFKLDNKMI